MRSCRVLPDKLALVYRIIFPNGKSYVGVTTNFKGRQSYHRRFANENIKKYKLQKAFHKYGYANCFWQILESDLSWQVALEREKYFIAQFDSFLHGYNSTGGGEGNLGVKKVMSAEARMKISEKLKGRKLPPEVLAKFKLRPRCKHTEATKKRLSEIKRGKPIKEGQKLFLAKLNGSGSVEAFDLQGKSFGVWENLSEMAKVLNVQRSNVTACLKGRLRKTGGFTFRYVSDAIEVQNG